MPQSDYMALSHSRDHIVAVIEVPDLFGKSVEVECVIVFFAARHWAGVAYHQRCRVAGLPAIISDVKDVMPSLWSDGEDAEFAKKFALIQSEMKRRANNNGERRSCISVEGKKLKVYLSPYEQARLIADGKKRILDEVKGLHRQSIYQFWTDPRKWREIVTLAEQGDLVIGPEVHAAYEKANAEGQLLLAPMMSGQNELMGLAELKNFDEIECRKDDLAHGFKAGKSYPLKTKTVKVKEYGTRDMQVERRDGRGRTVIEIKTADTVIEPTVIKFTSGEHEFLVGPLSDEAVDDLCGLFAKLQFISTLPEAEPDRWADRYVGAVSNYTPKNIAVIQKTVELARQKRKVVVFSGVKEHSLWLSRVLNGFGIPALSVVEDKGGKIVTMGPKGRADLVKDFVRDGYPVLCASIHAMNLGHNLDCASAVIVNGLPWDFATFDQAINRVHRITSKHPVDIYIAQTVCSDTTDDFRRGASLDQKMNRLIRDKGDSAMLALDAILPDREETTINLQAFLDDVAKSWSEPATVLSESALRQHLRDLIH